MNRLFRRFNIPENTPLNNIQIDKVLKKILPRHEYLGIFSRDEIERISQPPARKHLLIIVANTDVRAGPGEHWVTIFVFPRKKKVVILDPLGTDVLQSEIKRWLPTYKLTANKHIFQTSCDECGLLAIFFTRIICARFSRVILKKPE